MDISWIVFLAVASFFLIVAFGVPIESQAIAKEVTKDLVIGYLGYMTHEVKERIRNANRK